MSSPPMKLIVALFCLALSLAYLEASQCAEDKNKPEPIKLDDEFPPFPAPTECSGEHEQLHPGSLPTCEPTCKNPRPMCPKIFWSGLDYVPCFCKKPFVRNEKTKKCVQLEDCPA